MNLQIAKGKSRLEIFATFQGEGRYIGAPAVFIRLSMCNLHCVWCDTPYTWNWERTKFDHVGNKKFNMEEEREEANFPKVVMDIKKAMKRMKALPHLVITGGEPLLQQNALAELFDYDPIMREFFVEVETNGTIIPSISFAKNVSVFNVSPKLESSKNAIKQRRLFSVLRWHAESGKSIFKFVVQNAQDMDEVSALVKELKILPINVYIMPEGTTTKQLQENSHFIIEECKNNGYNFTTRLHVLVYGGAKRCI